MRAAEKGHLEVVQLLVQAGADKELQNKVRSFFTCMKLNALPLLPNV
jgi:hypothetical protein